MASLQQRIADLITAVGADIKSLKLAQVEDVPFSMAGAIATKTGPFKVYMEVACVVETVRISLGTAGSSATTVDVNRNGTTIYGTQANRPSMAASAVSALGGTASNGAFSAGDYLTVDVDVAGTGAQDLMVMVRMRRT